MAPPPPAPPPWTVVLLVSHHLDPRTLAKASCVSRSWNAIASSDHLWGPICLSRFPSLSRAPTAAAPSYRSIFANLSLPAALRAPPRPRVLLRHLFFTVDLFAGDAPVLSVAVAGDQLRSCCPGGGVFRFEARGEAAEVKDGGEMRAVWAVVMRGWEGGMVVVDKGGGGRRADEEREVWFSEELPAARCCGGGGGMVGEVGFEFRRGSGEVRVRMGMMSVVACRYVSVDDGLRYLQHFLLPP